MHLPRILILTLATCLVTEPVVAQAGGDSSFCAFSQATLCLDFETGGTAGLTLFENAIVANGETNAFLRITDNVNWQTGTAVLPEIDGTENRFVIGGRTGGANSNHHLDNIEVSADGDDFSVAADVRIGGGTIRPADGFSINVVRPDDPIIETGDQWTVVADHRFPEEGTQTGLSISFDEWTANEPGDIVGIGVRYDEVLLAQFPYPTLNGELEDITSLQTGPLPTETVAAIPAWTRVSIERIGSDVTIRFKGNEHKLELPSEPMRLDCTGDGFVLAADLSCATFDSLPGMLAAIGTIEGDLDLDGVVGFPDFLTMSGNFGENSKGGVYLNGDIDLNGEIEFGDFLVLSENFGGTASHSSSVPEPVPNLFAIGCGVLLLGRRRTSRDGAGIRNTRSLGG